MRLLSFHENDAAGTNKTKQKKNYKNGNHNDLKQRGRDLKRVAHFPFICVPRLVDSY